MVTHALSNSSPPTLWLELKLSLFSGIYSIEILLSPWFPQWASPSGEYVGHYICVKVLQREWGPLIRNRNSNSRVAALSLTMVGSMLRSWNGEWMLQFRVSMIFSICFDKVIVFVRCSCSTLFLLALWQIYTILHTISESTFWMQM